VVAMPQKKKLQIFISSTYSDMKEERQAAVEAILTAGHIPAGMELFAAGDESQMNVIKRWVDESDVYMLILGGRYGSIEPKSQKSYIQLEYEYAIEKEKPLFTVVIDEKYLEKKVKRFGSSVIEKDHPDKMREFRALVLSRMVRFWNDPREIKLSIFETLADFTNRPDLPGWVKGNETLNSDMIAEEIAQLVKENKELREKITNYQMESGAFNGLTFDEMYRYLLSIKVGKKQFVSIGWPEFETSRLDDWDNIEKICGFLGDSGPALIHVLWLYSKYYFFNSKDYIYGTDILLEMGLLTYSDVQIQTTNNINLAGYVTTEMGRRFLLRLKVTKGFPEEYALPVP
jgi:hypothetical protein